MEGKSGRNSTENEGVKGTTKREKEGESHEDGPRELGSAGRLLERDPPLSLTPLKARDFRRKFA